MATVSEREKVSHVIRRLGIGARPDLVAGSVTIDDAIAAGLDLSSPAAEPPDVAPPATAESARRDDTARIAAGFWFSQMLNSSRLIEERLVWFWHDHFATSIRKVRFPYLMWHQHLTLRRHATGSFAELLQAMAVDPAMLIYLDGVDNRAGAVNENFGREVMELFSLGRGAFSEADVVAASRAFTGWVVGIPRDGRRGRLPPWKSTFVPFLHDAGSKTLLGRTGDLDAAAAVDAILDQPACAEFVAGKLFRELTGAVPSPATAASLATTFRRDYSVMDLVEAIVAHPAFLDDEAVRSRVRTPLEKGIGLVQGFGAHDRSDRALLRALHLLGYQPWVPPNVAGFPEEKRLLGPYTLIHGFDLTAAVDPRQPGRTTREVFERLGLYDVATSSLAVVERAGSPAERIALALGSPEYLLT